MPKGVYKRTEEHNKKTSLARMGKIGYWRGKKRPDFSKWMFLNAPNRGKKASEETRKKHSETCKRLVLRPPSSLGIKQTPERIENRRLKCLGKKLSFEQRKKMSERVKGDKHPNWQGGISFQPYPTEWTSDLRESIRKRDNYICKKCGMHQNEILGWNKQLDIHHIDYDKENLNPDNLITLCRNCHIKTNFDRGFWINYFFSNYKQNEKTRNK